MSQHRDGDALNTSPPDTGSPLATRPAAMASVDTSSVTVSRRHSRLRLPELSTWSPVFAFALLVLVFSLAQPTTFFTRGTLLSILNDQAVLLMLALGLTVVLLCGEFDLSIASTATIGGVLSAGLIGRHGLPTWVVLLVVLAAGAAAGFVNGVLVSRFAVPALVATLAVSSILDGLTLWYTNGATLFSNLPKSFLGIARTHVLGAEIPVFYALALALGIAFALRYTVTGRNLYAIGGSREAARFSGIRVERHIVVAFMLSGMVAAAAGMVLTARNGSATPTAGAAYLLPAFAACFLGSATLRRGRFHVLGTVIAVYLIATGTAGFVILGAPFFTQQLFSGTVLILATAGARLLNRRTK